MAYSKNDLQKILFSLPSQMRPEVLFFFFDAEKNQGHNGQFDIWLDKGNARFIDNLHMWLKAPNKDGFAYLALEDTLIEENHLRNLSLMDEDVWELIVNTWRSVETIREDFQSWLIMLGLRKPNELFKKELPDDNLLIRIYRGGSPSGLSWTLREDKARIFAEKHAKSFSSKNPRKLRIFTTLINKSEVLFYNNDNLCEEVVIIPDPERVMEVEY